MNIVYTRYFQKSKVFLYPLLGIKKGYKHVQKNTYVIWDQFFDKNDYRLMAVYDNDNSVDYKVFVDTVLQPLPASHAKFKISESKDLFLFDMARHKHDFDCFYDGRFSQMTVEAKRRIKNYFGSVGRISKYISSFLDPEEFHDDYAEAFNVSHELIQDVYEVCSKPDIDKETFREKTLEVPFDLSDISISLDKTKTNE